MASKKEDNTEGSDVQLFEQILGYLNFSSGTEDAQFLAAINEVFRRELAASDASDSDQPTWRRVRTDLAEALDRLTASSGTFNDASQATRVLGLLDEFCPSYIRHHQDLLAHQPENAVLNSFFFGRACEALLTNLASTDNEEVVTTSIRQINDYIGYRPVATLETQKIEPYQHEWVRPIPVYVKDAGVAVGKYEAVVGQCIALLKASDPGLLRYAYFDPDHLDELAIDPRAYDFDHPANKRPNHHFGHWDPHNIGNDGFYHRFVVQQVTIDSLLKRVDEVEGIAKEELLTEAAAVLAGTVLMSSGISGESPDTHASTVSLAGLLAKIAAYRDEFYLDLLRKTGGSHGARLNQEAQQLRQPYAGVRQHLNRQLTKCRAMQLQRVHLARIFARMNYREASSSQADLVQVPSARIACQIDCKLSEARSAIDGGDLQDAVAAVQGARADLLRGIQCGAIVDPWNILGFDGNFSLFGPIENSLRDYRVDDLVDMVEEMQELYARLWSKAAATEQHEIAKATREEFAEFASWWHQFAAHELDTVEAENPLNVYEAAENVAGALDAWHQQGEASGDIGFWAPHVQKFDSCRAYWLVINTLLSRNDKVAALGLLMHWLSQSDHIPLEHGETSFFRLSLRWLAAALEETGTVPDENERTGWKRIRKFFDYLEANAGDYWTVPEFQPDENVPTNDKPEPSAEEEFEGEFEEEEEDDRFSAAYENVVFRDSADDGMEGSIFDFDSSDEDYLQQASRPIVTRITFLEQLAIIWKLTSVAWASASAMQKPDASDGSIRESMTDLLQSAHQHLSKVSFDLSELLAAVSRYKLARPGADPEAMVHYDRLRLLRDTLVDQIMNANVSVVEGKQFISAALDKDQESATQGSLLLKACLQGDREKARELWPQVQEELKDKPILYVPLNRGGPASTIVEVRSRQQLVQNLLFWLPRVGLLKESYELIELTRIMELTPVGMGAITEFDDLFEVGCRAAVNCMIDAKEALDSTEDADDWLVSHLEAMMEPLLRSWLGHSRTLRLSVLEQAMEEDAWNELVEFIQSYGRDLFTQRFLNLGNVRGILHQGVDHWLRMLEEQEDGDYEFILDALENGLDRQRFVTTLTLILESIVESYSEYRDYNSTTTQSDRGDMLHSLLDFLRLRVSYDRVVWNLRPVVLAHQVLASRGCEEAAEIWRRSLEERIRGEAKRHVLRLQELQKKYAMQLPSISKRVAERFMRPLMIDYLCALIEPAMLGEDDGTKQTAFERIQQQAETFMNEPSGAGLDVPTWLMSMEDVVGSVNDQGQASLARILERAMLPPKDLSMDDIQAEVDAWREENDDSE